MLTTLSNGRPGRRTLLAIETRTPVAGENANQKPEIANSDTLDFIASDESLDRFDEIVCASGWRLEAYRRNPVFQNAHQYGDILFTLGKALITEVRGLSPNPSGTPCVPHLFQRIQFATDINPVARIAYGLYQGKFLNAVSVGFIPLRWEDGGSESASARKFRRRYSGAGVARGFGRWHSGQSQRAGAGSQVRRDSKIRSRGGSRSVEKPTEGTVG